MTEAEAWREVARRWAEGQNVEDSLCREYMHLTGTYNPAPGEELWWNPPMEWFRPYPEAVYFWDHDQRDERVLAACFLAAMAEDDA